MYSDPVLESLNTAQLQAVTAPDGNLLVLAGAGSGKTRVLVHRIAWLINQGISAHGILAVTFTNKAAREMRARLEELLRLPTRAMWVGTFHGLAHRLLKAHWQEAGLPRNFQILDSDDQLRLVKRVCREMSLDESRWPPRQAQGFINAQKDEGLRAKHISPEGDHYHKTMLSVYQQYEQACQRGGLVDFAELLLRSHELWLDNPSILSHYQQRFQHILVDEFQDTNAIQYAWLRVLSGEQARVTAVGDDDQSIYGWRGARIENIHRFSEDFSNTEVVRLEQNYRSTSTILRAANSVIVNNFDRLGKELWTESEDGEPISLYAGFNEQDEARFVVERIEDWVRDANARNEVAILYRSNAQSRVLEEALLRVNMAYRVYGGHRFYERLEIRNALAYLRLIVNPEDDAAFERVVNTPTRGIGSKTLDVLRQRARDQAQPLWRAAQSILTELPGRARNALGSFLELINALAALPDELSLAELVEEVLEQSGLLAFHGKEKGEAGRNRVENLEELISACRSFKAEDEEQAILNQFLDNASLDAGEGQADAHEDSVQLMTLHSAKGLEFPLVFMVGMEENLFPHSMSVEEPGRLEEERRLCYVGITRARRKLVMSYAESRRLHGQEAYNPVSRFVREIDPNLVVEVRPKLSVSRPLSAGMPAQRPSAFGQREAEGFSLGQCVEHKVFGQGVITAFEGSGAHQRVQVNFEQEGTKMLVMAYAKLQAL